ncbi:MAG: NADH-quinone oxidoreductase subunit K, partial [Candidatus Omnitrophica bacterium]|nr:NADH-quinone oxidoreductase subunit K [Candidatus Omnitrophota bacterium]MDD5138380.1 NADH-quinone oxidoreductase subunit K [Candidatus Omnitrophota bacterium]MDD5538606.1 NADH-quinone oxidoreductase subunit K [Candidatus Omnitrophota bacterium]
MSAQALTLFWPFCLFIVVLFVIGFYCLLVTFNLIRALIGLELLIKAVTLLLVLVGYVTAHEALIQSLVITLIVMEVVIIAVAAGIALG